MAVFAAVLAVRAAALVARTVLSNDAAAIAVKVAGGKTRRDLTTDTREYSFTVLATSSRGAERQFTRVELRVAYRTRANFVGAVDLLAEEQMSVPPGATVDKTLRFITSNVIPRHCRVDAYTLFFTDARGERLTVDASLPEVLQADTDGVGPSTWGWD